MAGLFVCDVHIPPSLVTLLRVSGFEAQHVYEIGLATANDQTIWDFARAQDAIITTKDKDFARLDTAKPGPRVILVCTGNSPNSLLLEKFSTLLPEILGHFESGSRLVELR